MIRGPDQLDSPSSEYDIISMSIQVFTNSGTVLYARAHASSVSITVIHDIYDRIMYVHVSCILLIV